MDVTSARNYLGTPVSRVDGAAKVSGAAKYAAEHDAPGLAYGYVVSSTIARGRLISIDPNPALALPGVLTVLTHRNRPRMANKDQAYQDDTAPEGSPFRPLYDDKIRYSGQPVALVVAEDFDTARHAATLVHVEYQTESHVTEFERQRQESYDDKQSAKPRGDAGSALRDAAIRIDVEYRTPIEHHNPIELHAATVIWEDGKLTIYDKTQGPQNSQRYVRDVFGLSDEDVRVLSPYVGGAFGSGLRPHYHLALAAMAALKLKRSVRIVMTRQQMYSHVYRPGTVQRVALGADTDGSLTSIIHETLAMTSRFENFHENLTGWAAQLYRCPNMKPHQKLTQLDLYTPGDMRAPGGATGVYPLECAMDELAAALQMDPLALRLKNYSDRDQNEDKPYSSKELRECYRQGAEKFGWGKRNPLPRSVRDGHELVGWGVATGIWEAMQQTASARAVLSADGKLEVATATADIGPGTYTMLAQIGADALGVPIESVSVKLGDSHLPDSPVEGGSWTTASNGSAVQAACDKLKEKLLRLAQRINSSPLAGSELADVKFEARRIIRRIDPSHFVSVIDALQQADEDTIEEEVTVEPDHDDGHARFTHAAIFAEVKVDEQLGFVRVTRVVNALAAGRILNPKIARSQILGGVVWGIGMALQEETLVDHKLGRFVNANLGEYHVPVNADIHDIDVIFVEEHDAIVNPLGVKGVGEIGIVGTAAAIANAVYHATGKRVRDLPITLDKLLI
jgi:xanthine dehydrogenase YagR molybdenum-binding subunit